MENFLYAGSISIGSKHIELKGFNKLYNKLFSYEKNTGLCVEKVFNKFNFYRFSINIILFIFNKVFTSNAHALRLSQRLFRALGEVSACSHHASDARRRPALDGTSRCRAHASRRLHPNRRVRWELRRSRGRGIHRKLEIIMYEKNNILKIDFEALV